jgi:hypothetical protein
LEPIHLDPGDIGLIIHADKSIDLLLPGGDEGKPIKLLHQYLIGAAIGILGDESFRRRAFETFRLYHEADDNGEH